MKVERSIVSPHGEICIEALWCRSGDMVLRRASSTESRTAWEEFPALTAQAGLTFNGWIITVRSTSEKFVCVGVQE